MTRLGRFARVPFMGMSTSMRCAAASASDLPLLPRIHACETTLAALLYHGVLAAPAAGGHRPCGLRGKIARHMPSLYRTDTKPRTRTFLSLRHGQGKFTREKRRPWNGVRSCLPCRCRLSQPWQLAELSKLPAAKTVVRFGVCGLPPRLWHYATEPPWRRFPQVRALAHAWRVRSELPVLSFAHHFAPPRRLVRLNAESVHWLHLSSVAAKARRPVSL